MAFFFLNFLYYLSEAGRQGLLGKVIQRGLWDLSSKLPGAGVEITEPSPRRELGPAVRSGISLIGEMAD